MFRYFRKIREALLNENQFKRYLLYAIGELFLVVIGILIALQINNWNIERIDRQQEQLLLESISSKMSFNSFQQQIGNQRYVGVIDASTHLLQAVNSESTDLEIQDIERNLHTLRKRFLMGKSNTVSIYDEMIGSGQLILISSNELRDRVTELKENLQLLEVYEDIQIDFVENQLIPYLNKNTDIISIYANGSISDSTQYDNSIRIDYSSFYTSDRNRSYDDLLDDPVFANLLFDLIHHTKPLLPIYNRIGEDIEIIRSISNGMVSEAE